MLVSSSFIGIYHGVAAAADSLGRVVAAVHFSIAGSGAVSECSLSKGVASALVHRVEHKLCTFAANCASDFSQAQKWSETLQQQQPHAVLSGEAGATFWERWADKRSVDVVNATQQQLLQMNTGSCQKQCRNAQECVNIIVLFEFASHSLRMYLSNQAESLCATTDVCWQAMDIGIPDVQGTVCMLDIAQLVLSMGRELAMSVGCGAPWEALVMKKLSRAICTVSRIALVARVVAPELAHAARPPNDVCEDYELLCNDMQVLSVALSRIAVELSRRMAVAACPQAMAIVHEFCLLSRTASKKSRECWAQVELHQRVAA
jgi:hypothetical protein